MFGMGMSAFPVWILGLVVYAAMFIVLVAAGVLLGAFATAWMDPRLAQVRARAHERWKRSRHRSTDS